MTTVETITIDGATFQVKEGGWRCECGAIIKKESTLPRHVQTKSHQQNKERRRLYGNTTIHISLLTPGLIVHR